MRGNGPFLPKPAHRYRVPTIFNATFRGDNNLSIDTDVTSATNYQLTASQNGTHRTSHEFGSAHEPPATDGHGERNDFTMARSQARQNTQHEPMREKSMRNTFIPTDPKTGVDTSDQTKNSNGTTDRTPMDGPSPRAGPVQTSPYARSDASSKRMSGNDRDDTFSSVSGYATSITSQSKKQKCHMCRQQARPGSVECSTCSFRFHSRCLRISESEIRPGWRCRSCVRKRIAPAKQRSSEPSIASAPGKASIVSTSRPSKRQKLDSSPDSADLPEAASINLSTKCSVVSTRDQSRGDSVAGVQPMFHHAISNMKAFSGEVPVNGSVTDPVDTNPLVSHSDALFEPCKIPTIDRPKGEQQVSNSPSASPQKKPPSLTVSPLKQARLQRQIPTELAPCKGCRRKTMPSLPSGKLGFCSACKNENKHKEPTSKSLSQSSQAAAQVVVELKSKGLATCDDTKSANNAITPDPKEVRSTNPESQGKSADELIGESLPLNGAAASFKTTRQDADSKCVGSDKTHHTPCTSHANLDALNAMICSPEKTSSQKGEARIKVVDNADTAEAVKKHVDNAGQSILHATVSREINEDHRGETSINNANARANDKSKNRASQKQRRDQSTSGFRSEAVADAPMLIQIESEKLISKQLADLRQPETHDSDEMDIDSAYDSFRAASPIAPSWRDTHGTKKQRRVPQASEPVVSHAINENDLRNSLYAEWPEYEPKNRFNRAEKIAEISQRPRRKSLIGKPALYSQTGRTDILAPRRNARAKKAKTEQDPKSYDAFGSENSQPIVEADGTIYQHYDNVDDFLGVREEMLLTLYESTLRYRDARRGSSGNLSRHTLLHPTGI